MTIKRATILLADDEETLRQNLAQVLGEEGFNVVVCPDGAEALRALKERTVDAIITDLRMPGVPGMELIDHAATLAPQAPIIAITAFGEVETAVEAMRKGVRDYICKPLIFDELIFKLKGFLKEDNLLKQNRIFREEAARRNDCANVVCVSKPMTDIVAMVDRIADSPSNVLISGDSGTGKEVLARCIHMKGPTAEQAFIAVNCGGLARDLVESEMFGYRRGSFTGAREDRMGYFEAADGGTLFLDEIGNLPLASQAILLRAIEEKAVTRIGDNRPRSVNIRIIAATNRNLEQAIDAGEFREDLYYRLNVIRIFIPPLRTRVEDIEPLIEHFVKKYNEELMTDCPGFRRDAIDLLKAQPWRGNVRELENMVERALIFAEDREVTTADLSLAPGAALPTTPVADDLRYATRSFERTHIRNVLVKHNDDKVAAAAALGIGLSSLYRKLEEGDDREETRS
ncbi:MAG: sigma-54-dependent Fis family transcriptional regulator, partial [Phycisphaerales bacterium]